MTAIATADAFRQTCDHEAAHVAAALLLGLDVVAVVAHRDLGLNHDVAGLATVLYSDDDAGLRAGVIVGLAGRLETSEPGWPPPWPPNDTPTSGDERNLIDRVQRLRLDEAGYAQLVTDAIGLCQRPLSAAARSHLTPAGTTRPPRRGRDPPSQINHSWSNCGAHNESSDRQRDGPG